MKSTQEMTAIHKLRSIETAEQYLIARTHAELGETAGRHAAEAMYKPVWAIALTAAAVLLLQFGFVRNLLAATV